MYEPRSQFLSKKHLAGRATVENIKNYRAVALLCRQRAALCPEASWHWLAEAERYEDLAEAEIEAHFKECNGGVEFDANLAAARVLLTASFPHPASPTSLWRFASEFSPTGP